VSSAQPNQTEPAPENAAPSKRQLTLLDCLGIGVNGIVGSGIFLLPAALWRHAGGKAPIAWLLVGGLCCLVALCFAEAAARTDRSGGPYRYACDAFGPSVGFIVGWVTLVSTLLGYSAVARGFGIAAADLLLLKGNRIAETALSCGVVSLLCVVNVLGVRRSARTSDVISAVKLLSLLIFIAVGLFFIQLKNLQVVPPPPPPLAPDDSDSRSVLNLFAGDAAVFRGGLLAAAFAGLFATTGFECIPVPAGEAKNPRRTVPLAMVASVLATTVIYILVQVVATGVHPDLGSSKTPLADAAFLFAGARGKLLMNVAFVISSFGFCAGSALVGPRYLEAFAEDRFMPALFQKRHPRLGTPMWAVIALSLLVLILLASGLPFEQLADVSNVAVVLQYSATCIAVLVLRRRAPAGADAFVIPGGPLVPLLALLGCTVFMLSVRLYELKLAFVFVVLGVVFGSAIRWLSRPKKT
jgi:amino acid transporter